MSNRLNVWAQEINSRLCNFTNEVSHRASPSTWSRSRARSKYSVEGYSESFESVTPPYRTKLHPQEHQSDYRTPDRRIPRSQNTRSNSSTTRIFHRTPDRSTPERQHQNSNARLTDYNTNRFTELQNDQPTQNVMFQHPSIGLSGLSPLQEGGL